MSRRPDDARPDRGRPERPQVTVTSSGGAVPDLLVAEPARRRRRGLTTGLLLVALLAGLVVLLHRSDAAPAARTPPESTAGLTAEVVLVQTAGTVRPLVVQLAITITGASGPAPLRLRDVQVAGLLVRIAGELPQTLGQPLRLGAAAVVNDCAVPVQQPRWIDLVLQRGEAPPARLRAVARPDAVRALDRLVARTCRRLRG